MSLAFLIFFRVIGSNGKFFVHFNNETHLQLFQ